MHALLDGDGPNGRGTLNTKRHSGMPCEHESAVPGAHFVLRWTTRFLPRRYLCEARRGFRVMLEPSQGRPRRRRPLGPDGDPCADGDACCVRRRGDCGPRQLAWLAGCKTALRSSATSKGSTPVAAAITRRCNCSTPAPYRLLTIATGLCMCLALRAESCTKAATCARRFGGPARSAFVSTTTYCTLAASRNSSICMSDGFKPKRASASTRTSLSVARELK
mmetsp:Transcript_20139/g.46488  ORF Transcript_20139/g.46488 Transcript_20139/m.46488 type:complete len:221 (+) Transcript_20139:146-808(+)